MTKDIVVQGNIFLKKKQGNIFENKNTKTSIRFNEIEKNTDHQIPTPNNNDIKSLKDFSLSFPITINFWSSFLYSILLKEIYDFISWDSYSYMYLDFTWAFTY